MKRALACILVLSCLALGTSACSTRTVQTGWCAFHAYRLVHDIRTHHKGWAAFQAILAAHHCSKALRGLR